MIPKVLQRPTLVLNRNWQPVNVATVARALVLLWNKTARAVDPADYQTYTWADWLKLRPRDGEMFVQQITDSEGKPESVAERFRTICSICGLARSSPHEREDQMQYHIFDLADSSGTVEQHERFRLLDLLVSYMEPEEGARLVQVETKNFTSIDEVPDYHYRCVEEGYEGAILRGHNLLYQTKRANDMRKLKSFMDAEYEVVGTEKYPGAAIEQFVDISHIHAGTERAIPNGYLSLHQFTERRPADTSEKKIEYWRDVLEESMVSVGPGSNRYMRRLKGLEKQGIVDLDQVMLEKLSYSLSGSNSDYILAKIHEKLKTTKGAISYTFKHFDDGHYQFPWNLEHR